MTELTYTKNGDYLIPDLTLSETPEDARPLGKYRKPCKCEPFGLHSGSDQGTGWICCLLRYAGRRTGLYGVYGERTQRKSDDVSVEKARQYRCSVAGLQDFAFHT